MKNNLQPILIAVLVGLIPIFVSVTLYSASKGTAALEAACTVRHDLELHAAEQAGTFKLIQMQLNSIDAKLERHGEILEKGDK